MVTLSGSASQNEMCRQPVDNPARGRVSLGLVELDAKSNEDLSQM